MVPESPLRKMQRTMIGRTARIAAVVLVVGGLGVQSGSAAEDPQYPGLPEFPVAGDWVGPRATGINYVEKAKQWVRVPPVILGAFARTTVERQDTLCLRLGPYISTADYHATGFFRSPRGAAKPWGQIGPFTVRTVAFGSIPVEAAVMITQPRDAEDLPVGLELKQSAGRFCPGAPNVPRRSPYPDQQFDGARNSHLDPGTVDGKVQVGVVSLAVDGVNLKIAKSCRTRELGTISLKGREYYSANPDNFLPDGQPKPFDRMTTQEFDLSKGGLLNGTVDIPAFAGCITSAGEDVSRLLTATVSGADNPVIMRSEGLKSVDCIKPDAPTGPGQACGPLGDLPFPSAN